MLTPRILRDINEEILPEFESYLSKLSGKTILITGGNGLIPSYIVDTINIFNKKNNAGIRMIVINKNPLSESSRLSHLINDNAIRFIAHDMSNGLNISEKVDIIIHAASRANPSSFLADPLDTIGANVKGAWSLLEYARENKIEDFIFFSSGEIYGNPVKEFLPTPEEYSGNADPLNTWSCYIESKRFVESLCMAYNRQHNVPIKILRILLSYGPGIRDDGKVISDFFNYAIKDRVIKIRDNGEARRSFCYISDTIRAIFYAWFKGSSGEAYNIADDTNNPSIKELSDAIAALCGSDVCVEVNKDFKNKEIYGVNNRLLNINKIKKLGFKINVGLKQGLYRLLEHYQQSGKIKK